MKKLSLNMIVVLSLVFVLTGCTLDSKELDDQVYTLVIGADKAVDNKIRVTVQYPTYKGGTSGGAGGTQKKSDGEGSKEGTGEVGGTIVQTVEASSILEAVNLLNTSTSRRISLVHAKMVIFSEDLAREGIGRYLEPIARFRETRRIMQVAVCRGNAGDFIMENRTLIGESIAKAMELMVNQSANTGFFPRSTFQDFYRALLSPYEQPYATYAGLNDFSHLKPLGGEAKSPLKTEYEILPGDEPRKGDLKREFIGTAVFDGEKMVGSLNSYETRYLLMINGQFQRGTITIPDRYNPDMAIPLDVRLGRKPKVKSFFENGVPVIDLNLIIEADLGAIQNRTGYEKLSKIGDLDSQIESFIKNGIIKTIEKVQKNWGTDIFGFGGYVARNFSTVPEFEKYNWLSHFSEARVNVELKANVRRTGLMMSSSPVRNSKETIITNGEP